MGWKDVDLTLYERVSAVQSLFPEEIENCLNAKKAALETNLKLDCVEEPFIYFHGKAFESQSSGVTNYQDFDEDAIVALSNQPLIRRFEKN